MLSNEAEVQVLWDKLHTLEPTDSGHFHQPEVQNILLKEILLQLVAIRNTSSKGMETYEKTLREIVESYKIALVDYREALERMQGR